MNDFSGTLKTIFEKKGVDKIKLHPLIYAKALSFNSYSIRFSLLINKYLYDDKELINNLIYTMVPKQKMPYIRYIKSSKELKSEYDFVLEPYRQYLKMSKREFNSVLPILLKQIEDKEVLKSLMLFVGSNKKYFKKYKIELKETMDKKQQEGLRRWFN